LTVHAKEVLDHGKTEAPHSDEIIRKLREAEKLQAEGLTISQICQNLESTEQTFYRWRSQFGGMKAEEMKELKRLAEENRWLKKLVADQALDIAAYKEIAKETGRPFASVRGGRDVDRLPRCVSAKGLLDHLPALFITGHHHHFFCTG
jgi:transposase-like protein